VRVEPMANRREEAEAAANDRAHRDSSGFARRGEWTLLQLMWDRG
jgi:hypothetical protein